MQDSARVPDSSRASGTSARDTLSAQSPPEDDVRVAFIRKLVRISFPACSEESLHRQFASDSFAHVLFDFIHIPDTRLLLLTDHGKGTEGSLRVYASPPPKLFASGRPQTILYVIKLQNAALAHERVFEQLTFGTLEGGPLQSLEQYLQNVVIPLVANPHNQKQWPEMVTSSVINNLNTLYANLQITLGKTKGTTRLPLPWDQILVDEEARLVSKNTSNQATNNGKDASTHFFGKDRIHNLESSIITWTKQIKTILSEEPEVVASKSKKFTLIKVGNNKHLGPAAEIEFWTAKARHLNAIFTQLQSASIRRILQSLSSAKSSYSAPFAKLCKEVFQARTEANDNVYYLKSLEPLVQKLLDSPPNEFSAIQPLFQPICHCILLIWKNSRYYNTPARLVILIRQVSNEIIRKATAFIDGKTLIQLADEGELMAARGKLLTCLRVCAHFKSVYFDYKAKSAIEVPVNPWQVPNATVFMRMDSFLERCHDVLDLMQILAQFGTLESVEVGGTKGKTLTTSVYQIYQDFVAAVADIRDVTYDLLDLDERKFDNDFYHFRSQIKELEKRLLSVVRQAFEDAKTIRGQIKCLEGFREILERPRISHELERDYIALLKTYTNDLYNVQHLFLENREHPPLAPNLPPCSGAVSWSRGIAERVRFPMTKIKDMVPRTVLEREEAKDCVKLYTNFLALLQEYEVRTIEQWSDSVEASSKEKLKLPLLRRENLQSPLVHDGSSSSRSPSLAPVPSSHAATGPLAVNFDSALVQLLREVKYFLQLGVDIPEEALAIYKRAEVFRRQTGNLELVVDMYNSIHAQLLPVERPLVKAQLDRMDLALSKGVKSFNWKSHGIDVFLKEVMTDVNDAKVLLGQLKSQQERVDDLLAGWKAPPLLFKPMSKPMSCSDFTQMQQESCREKYSLIKEGGNEIQQSLKETLKCLRISQGSPDWRAYVEFISGMVEDGLCSVVLQSLQLLRDQLDPEIIEKNDLSALVEIELDLYGREVVYSPMIESNAAGEGLRDVVLKRIEGILHCSAVFRRLDSVDGTYLKQMRENAQVQLLISDISGFLNANDQKCRDLRKEMLVYEYLWATDLSQMFAEFLMSAWEGGGSPEEKEKAIRNVLRKSDMLSDGSMYAKSDVQNQPMTSQELRLPLFEEKIRFFLALQVEISESKHSREVGFVRVNSLPIKQALSTCVTKWIYTFTQFLQDCVVNQLSWIHAFICRVHIGLDEEIPTEVTTSNIPQSATQRSDGFYIGGGALNAIEDASTALLKCMEYIRDVKIIMKEERVIDFKSIESVVAILKTNEIVFDTAYIGKESVTSFLEQAPVRWDALVNKTFKKKERIQPQQHRMSEAIKAEVSEFQRRMSALQEDFKVSAPFHSPSDNRLSLDNVYEMMDTYQLKLAQVEAKAAHLMELETLFELPVTKNEVLNSTRSDFKLLKQVWDFAAMLETTYTFDWNPQLWTEVDLDALLHRVDDLERLRVELFGRLKTRVNEWPVYKYLEERLTQTATVLPLAKSLRSPILRERHWKHLTVMSRKHADIGSNVSLIVNLSNHASLRLENIFSLELYRCADEVNELIEMASREFKIEQQLSSIETMWTTSSLEFVPLITASSPAKESYSTDSLTGPTTASTTKLLRPSQSTASLLDTQFSAADSNVLFILKPPNALVETLEEHQVQLQSMAGMGKFVEHFKSKVDEWQRLLGTIETVLKRWMSLQRQWSSLESIFLNPVGDIQRQMPSEYQKFVSIDEEMRDLCADAYHNPSVMTVCCAREGREGTLCNLQSELEICQKALNKYLGGKKDAFPRFYFVSNAALLEILANGSYPMRLQAHIGNCFEGIAEFIYEETKTHDGGSDSSQTQYMVAGMVSKEGENVRFTDSHVVHGAVESWFSDLLFVVQETLRHQMLDAVETSALWNVDCPRGSWVFNYPAQIALLAGQIVWTEETEAALEEAENGSEDAIKRYWDVCTVRLEQLIKLVQGQLSALDRQKVITLITIDVHARDVVQHLLVDKVSSNCAFEWQSQLRCYSVNAIASLGATPKRDVQIRICDFQSLYSYEYIGSGGRLVITPLTDRCYVTLTTALRLCLGGAPAGPAGTGKTETTKDLSKALGLPCYVFNCSEQMNYLTMGEIFQGLAQTGAWGCFDEFNRISVEVLSVVATQVQIVLDATSQQKNMRKRASINFGSSAENSTEAASMVFATPAGQCNFFGKTINLIPTVGLFITMNPGYAGRAELPENLKALFRSCAMIKPDLQPICENMLMAEGFLQARALSFKFVALYELGSEMVSDQKHYDWGLRAVKSVLLVAGAARRLQPKVPESRVLMQVLYDFNIPRLLPADSTIFLGLLQDLFASTKMQVIANEELRAKCQVVCSEQVLQPEDGFLRKVLELNEAFQVRHSVMLLGAAGSGKTTIWQSLAASHNVGCLKPVAVYESVNPKAVTADELYGFMNLDHDWKDGALSSIMRNMTTESAPYHLNQLYKWVVLDGDIDAVWIESMNTVMDDNKVLTLVSNERIPLSSSMRLLFEIHSLVNATPATVSRAGIIYLNESDVGWAPAMESWLQKRDSQSEVSILPSLFSKYIYRFMDLMNEFRAQNCVLLPPIATIQTLCCYLEAQLLQLDESQKSPDVLHNSFLYSALWAFGGGLQDDPPQARKSFSAQFKSIAKFKLPNSPNSSRSEQDTGLSGDPNASIGDQDLFDWYYDCATNEFHLWQDDLQNGLPGSTNAVDSMSSSLIVPTVDFKRTQSMIGLLLSNACPVLLAGYVGTGKTALLLDLLKSKEEDVPFIHIAMHHFMTAKDLQFRLEQYLEKRSGRSYGPSGCPRLTFFVDDINMPCPETFGSQTTGALLRQYFDYGGWYDRHDLSMKKVILDVSFVACMNPHATTYTMNPRLLRHFAVLALPAPTKSTMQSIYANLLEFSLHGFADKIKRLGQALISASIDLHLDVCRHFALTADKFYHVFSLRDLNRLFDGLAIARPETFMTNTLKFSRLWLHEVYRVYSDRFSSLNEVQRFTSIVTEITKKYLEEDQAQLFADPLICAGFLEMDARAMNDAGETLNSALVNYGPIQNKQDLVKAVHGKLEEFNESQSVLNLVLFDQALEHVTRIVRIISQSAGHALLVGVGGSGKQSLTRLAAFICQATLTMLQTGTVPNYAQADLKEELKDLCRKAGVRPAKPVVLLISDSQILTEVFLIPLHELLMTGQVSDLFSMDDMDVITGSIRVEAKARGIPDSKADLQAFFWARVKENVRIVLALSPVGADLRERCRKFPSLIHCCTIDWFHAWPKEALIEVASQFLQDMDLSTSVIQENVCHHMAAVHLSVQFASTYYAKTVGRYNYVTPTSFLELINFYRALLADKRQNRERQMQRLEVGLATLRKTARDVSKLQEELKATMKIVEQRKLATDELLEEMGKQRGEAEVKRKRADEERAKATQAADTASSIEAEAATELAAAKPALEGAQQAVNCLNKASLTELKSMGKPPAGVDRVTAAVLMMVKGETRNFSWDNAKKMMARVDLFKQSLEQYDKEHIPSDVVSRVEALISEDPNFTYEKMKTRSVAAANLCVWVINIISFHHVYSRVKPLMDKLEEAKQSKAEADKELSIVQGLVAEVERHLATLQASFREATNERAKVEAEANACQIRLQLAERLVNGLSTENERWSKEMEVLKTGEEALIGNTLLSAAFVSYAGAFDANFRGHLWKRTWLPDILIREIPIALDDYQRQHVLANASDDLQNGNEADLDALKMQTGRYDESVDDEDARPKAVEQDQDFGVVDPVAMLSDSGSVAQWMNEGLPSDRISVENGCIVAACSRWPLLVDPQLQGITWLRGHDFKASNTDPAASSLVVVNCSQKNWLRTIKNGISNGQKILLESLDEVIDPALEPILMRRMHRKGRSLLLRFASDEIEVDPNFRLFLHTKLSNPHYRPEVLAYCTLIDFCVTEQGLEDQILANVVNLEQPNLELEKQKLQQQFNDYQIQLRQLESELLERLAHAPDDILSDVVLIESLEQTKAAANDVTTALIKGRATERELNLARDVYRPVANEASMTYFLMNQLCKISHMYRYSLETFMTYFCVAMDSVKQSTDEDQAPSDATTSETNGLSEREYEVAVARVPLLIQALRWTMYEMVSRGLMEEHKLIYLFQLVLVLLRRKVIGETSGFTENHARFLLQSPKSVGSENTIQWLSEAQWQSLQALSSLDGFERFVNDLEESEARFREWYNSPHPETEKLPLDWRELDKTSPFWKLLVVKAMRPDRMTQAISNFIGAVLPDGSEYLNCDDELSHFAVLQSSFKESKPWIPMFFVMSSGSNVVGNVDHLALSDNGRIRSVDYHSLSLGQGQELMAMDLLQRGIEAGHWVLLNNIHLMPSWLKELDKWLEQVAKIGSSPVSGLDALPSRRASSARRSRAVSVSVATIPSIHPDFRLFVTSDPSPLIPIGLLERSITLISEPPTGLKANVKRSFCSFASEEFDELEARTRVILFALCYFHGLMLERGKFGAIGFNRKYPFAQSDLSASATLITTYMDSVPAHIPWQDLRYLVGEIVYGGHIVNERDRVVAMTYLTYYLRDELFEELNMIPYADDSSHRRGNADESLHKVEFIAPKLSFTFEKMLDHIDRSLSNETPESFGMHPNAEIVFRTAQGEKLVQTVSLLSSASSRSASTRSGSEDAVKMVAEGMVQDILDSYREVRFDVPDTISFSTKEDSRESGSNDVDEVDPFHTVVTQECRCMNLLLRTMTRSLLELEQGLKGEITITDSMDDMQNCLYLDVVPRQWEKVGFPTQKSLGQWLINLQQRIVQLQEWYGMAPDLPYSIWLPGLFHPQSLLTAVLQTSARRNEVELDKLEIAPEITKRALEAVDSPSRDGLFVHGLWLEGARWDVGGGVLERGQPKEMAVPMPVINIRAVPAATAEDGSSSKKPRVANSYECPVFQTQERGETYLFSVPLRTKAPPAKWILAGVALVLEIA